MKNYDEADKRLQALIAAGASDSITTMLSATILEGRANELLSKGQTEAAELKFAEQIEALARAEAQDVVNPIPRILLAQTYFNKFHRNGNASYLDDALLALARADKISPGNLQTSMVRVDVLKAKGDNSGAIAELRRVLTKNVDNPNARRQLLQLYLDSGDNAAAFDTVSQAIEANPSLGFWHETLGDLYHALRNDPVNAYKCYTKAYELVPNPPMLGKLLDCGLALQPPDYAAAIERLKTHTSDMDNVPTLHLIYARSLNGIGKHDEGLEQMRQCYAQYRERIASGLTPAEDINEWYSYSRYFFDPVKEVPQLDEFVSKMNADPDSYELRILSKLWIGTGFANLARAAELQTKAIEKCPPDKTQLKSTMLVELGNIHLLGKHYDVAAGHYEQAVQLDGGNVDALNNLAYIYADLLNQPQKALPFAEKAGELRPKDPSVLDTCGWVNFLVGNVDKAKEHLRASIKLDEKSAATQVHYAHVLFKSGDKAGAIDHLKQAGELKPDPETQAKIQKLQQEINNAT